MSKSELSEVALGKRAHAVICKLRDAFSTGEMKWVRGKFTDGTNGYCLVGGLAHLASKRPQDVHNPVVERAILDLLPLLPRAHVAPYYQATASDDPAFRSRVMVSAITNWNDKASRRGRDVVALLDKACNLFEADAVKGASRGRSD